MARKAKYKPLLFTTTLRSPRRLKVLLNILLKFDGQKLTDELAEDILGELIRYGLYRPVNNVNDSVARKWGGKKISESSPIGLELLTDSEVNMLLEANPQKHKEAGFKRGWPSRFATIYDFAKELGFVYYWIDEPITFSVIGKKLAESVEVSIDDEFIISRDTHPEFEQQAFLNSLVKYQRNNPFLRVKNENIPLILLLQVITKLNNDKECSDAGISKLELPLVIYWKDNDAEKLYQRIKKLRQDYGYSPSWEVIIKICRDEIMKGKDNIRNEKSIMVDYCYEFIRKMRLTGLISLRGGGRFIDINVNEQEKVNYVLKNYSSYKKYSTETSYFKYISDIDQNLITITPKTVSESDKERLLSKWVAVYSWNLIKSEMLILSRQGLTDDDTLKYISSPVRLEFLTALAVKSRFPDIKVIPNYPIDDEGIPTSTAGGVGNTGDIECFEGVKGVLIEVTMSQGRTQTMMEVWPISRHLEEFSKKVKNSMCLFVAPSIFSDSEKQIQYVYDTEKRFISPKTIVEFIKYLESKPTLHALPSV